MTDHDAATTADASAPAAAPPGVPSHPSVALAAILTARPSRCCASRTSAAPPPPDAAAAASGFARPSDWEPHRPAVHLTPEQNWMNDPQRPFLLDGVWHYYYLYNADYPEGNGTAWYHATSTDPVHWKDRRRDREVHERPRRHLDRHRRRRLPRTPPASARTPSIAMVTQQSDGVQRQSLFVSLDSGYSFDPTREPRDGQPGRRRTSATRVLRDDERRNLGHGARRGPEDRLLHLARPQGLDVRLRLRHAHGLGMLECPTSSRCPSTATRRTRAGCSPPAPTARRRAMTTGTAYWVGDWTADLQRRRTTSKWLDRGSDFYAAVTWDDPRLPAEERQSRGTASAG